MSSKESILKCFNFASLFLNNFQKFRCTEDSARKPSLTFLVDGDFSFWLPTIEEHKYRIYGQGKFEIGLQYRAEYFTSFQDEKNEFIPLDRIISLNFERLESLKIYKEFYPLEDSSKIELSKRNVKSIEIVLNDSLFHLGIMDHSPAAYDD